MTDVSAAPPPDPIPGRRPTSHERRTRQPWDASYQHGPAPWDIGGPQPAVVRLGSAGAFSGRVLDVGCGTGENALHVAGLGLSVVGVDVAETALETARAEADRRGLAVEFIWADALRLAALAAGSRRCWTAACSTPSTSANVSTTWRVWAR